MPAEGVEMPMPTERVPRQLIVAHQHPKPTFPDHRRPEPRSAADGADPAAAASASGPGRLRTTVHRSGSFRCRSAALQPPERIRIRGLRAAWQDQRVRPRAPRASRLRRRIYLNRLPGRLPRVEQVASFIATIGAAWQAAPASDCGTRPTRARTTTRPQVRRRTPHRPGT